MFQIPPAQAHRFNLNYSSTIGYNLMQQSSL
jgi:hypothetical protein